MTTIMVEVPDEIAAQIAALRGRLPDLLIKALKSETGGKKTQVGVAGESPPLYREIIDYLASDPLPEQIVAFKISSVAQERLEDLLDKNQEDGLTAEETAELDAYLQARDLMVFLKANVRPAPQP